MRRDKRHIQTRSSKILEDCHYASVASSSLTDWGTNERWRKANSCKLSGL